MDAANTYYSLSDIAEAVRGNANANGNSNWNDGAWWIIILFLFMFMGMGRIGGQPAPAQAAPSDVASSGEVQNGFNHQAVMTGINGITQGLHDGFSDAEVSRCTKAQSIVNGITNAAYASQQQISEASNRSSAEIADLKSTMQQEFTQVQINQDQNTQKILDKMCQDKIDAKNEKIAELQQQLNEANRQASQAQQTGQIINSLRQPAPIPAYTVPNPSGCNCGYYNNGQCCA